MSNIELFKWYSSKIIFVHIQQAIHVFFIQQRSHHSFTPFWMIIRWKQEIKNALCQCRLYIFHTYLCNKFILKPFIKNISISWAILDKNIICIVKSAYYSIFFLFFFSFHCRNHVIVHSHSDLTTFLCRTTHAKHANTIKIRWRQKRELIHVFEKENYSIDIIKSRQNMH